MRLDAARESDMPENSVSLLLVGDTNIQNRLNPAGAFAHVLPLFETADVLFGNMEMPLRAPSTDPLFPDIPHKGGWKHSDPAMLEGLLSAGFCAVGCANNVTYGREAVLDTITCLESSKLAYCGVGRKQPCGGTTTRHGG